MIDQSTVNKIFDAADIVEVIQDFISLKKRGVNYTACCPFHDEKTPSFSVSQSKGIFKCFGCGKAGNAVTFVQLHENISYVESLKYVAKKYGIEVHERELSEDEKRKNDDRESILVAMAYAENRFVDNLLNTEEGKSVGLSYFLERGFSMATIERFKLGFSLRNSSDFASKALADGYKKEFLLQAGLCYANEKSTQLGDFFAGRVMFPIHSVTGRVIAFGARTLLTDKKVAKYKNSPESALYVKNKTLYGLYFAKKSIVKEQKCYLVEGYTDVISMFQAGVENVVASCGTSLTVEQAKLMKRFAPDVTVMYDGDSAGISASMRGIDILLEEGLNVKVVLFSDNEDPDSFARNHSASEVEAFLKNNEQDFIVFKTKKALAESQNDPVKKSKLIVDVVHSIAVIPDNITRMVYVKECAQIFGVDEQVLVDEIRKERAKKYYGKEYKEIKPLITEKKRQEQVANQPRHDCDEQEKELSYFILKFGEKPLFENDKGTIDTVAQYIIGELKESDIFPQNSICRLIFDEYDRLLGENIDFSLKNFINHVNPQIAEFAANIISEEYELSTIWTKFGNSVSPEEDDLKTIIPRAITVYKIKILSRAIERLKLDLQICSDSDDTETKNLILKQIMALNKTRSILSKELGRIFS